MYNHANKNLGADIYEYKEAMPDGLACYRVLLDRETVEVSWVHFTGYEGLKIGEVSRLGKRSENYYVYVLAENETHAIKIANDLFEQYKEEEKEICYI